MAAGRLITIEGIDGAGKTTLAGALVPRLASLGRDVHLLREPGGVQAAERVRELVKDPALEIAPRAEALLYAAARAQLVHESLAPRLRAGGWVVLDRFVDSSLAYQGAGRELGLEAVRAINQFGTGGLTADRTLWLDIDPGAGARRSRDRGQPVDRLEREQSDFFTRVAQAYTMLWQAEPQRIRRIDAAQPPEAVLADCLDAISDLI